MSATTSAVMTGRPVARPSRRGGRVCVDGRVNPGHDGVGGGDPAAFSGFHANTMHESRR